MASAQSRQIVWKLEAQCMKRTCQRRPSCLSKINFLLLLLTLIQQHHVLYLLAAILVLLTYCEWPQRSLKPFKRYLLQLKLCKYQFSLKNTDHTVLKWSCLHLKIWVLAKNLKISKNIQKGKKKSKKNL